jgi:hypothetical protein
VTGTSLITPCKRSRGYQGSAPSLRRSHQGVNGALTGFLCAVSGVVGPVFGKGAGYG